MRSGRVGELQHLETYKRHISGKTTKVGQNIELYGGYKTVEVLNIGVRSEEGFEVDEEIREVFEQMIRRVNFYVF